VIIKSPISSINCPTRRESRPYGTIWRNFHAINACTYQTGDLAARLDYAANAGAQAANQQANQPTSLLQGLDSWDPGDLSIYNGVFYVTSATKIGKLEDGTSKTYLIGEKYLNPEHYTTGGDGADNENWCTGFNNDNHRTAFTLPRRDRVGVGDGVSFGSAHQTGFNMSYADGHVASLGYDIDLFAHRAAAHRRDGGKLFLPPPAN
jgi:prepilin-type processing-associated H-X9-DG protein